MKDPKLQALSALFLAFPSQERTDNEKDLGRVYLMAVEGIAAGFVALACERFIQGRVERASMTWRPTPAELATEARALQEREHRHRQYASLPSRERPKALPAKREPFMPYPKLWEALAGDDNALFTLNRLSFDEMTTASRTFATKGIEEARRWINDRRGKASTPRGHLKPLSAPAFDISDFPDANATRAELQAWEARQKRGAA